MESGDGARSQQSRSNNDSSDRGGGSSSARYKVVSRRHSKRGRSSSSRRRGGGSLEATFSKSSGGGRHERHDWNHHHPIAHRPVRRDATTAMNMGGSVTDLFAREVNGLARVLDMSTPAPAYAASTAIPVNGAQAFLLDNGVSSPVPFQGPVATTPRRHKSRRHLDSLSDDSSRSLGREGGSRSRTRSRSRSRTDAGRGRRKLIHYDMYDRGSKRSGNGRGHGKGTKKDKKKQMDRRGADTTNDETAEDAAASSLDIGLLDQSRPGQGGHVLASRDFRIPPGHIVERFAVRINIRESVRKHHQLGSVLTKEHHDVRLSPTCDA